MNKIYHGTVENGKFSPDDKKFKEAFFGHEGKRVSVTVKRYVKKRSTNQNSYMWGVVYRLISEHTGTDDKDIHFLLRLEFWCDYLDENGVVFEYKPDCKHIKRPKSTVKMRPVDMEGYLRNCRLWASEFLGVFIPLPNEVEV